MDKFNSTSQTKFKLRHKQLMLGIVAATASLSTTTVFAQDASPTYTLEEVIVTAQKRSESLQDIPIAVSAFSGDGLKDKGLLGGADLEKAIPNVSFGLTGFGRYNFQIRGIGGQIQGASTDTGVGVHVNNIPVTVNRLAAAEMYDIERVEVLRGPQGTLYGRNATGGVINTLTAAAENEFSAKLTGEYGNYNTKRINGHVNVPVSDTFAVRFAGTSITRDGTIKNEGTGNDVDDRDIWSTRLSLQWEPNDAFRARFMWEHFEQDDSTGGNRKHVCAADPGPTSVGGVPTDPLTQSLLSTGCLDVQVEDPSTNGLANSLHTVPGVFALVSGAFFVPPGSPPNPVFQLANGNVFAGQTINPDLHTVESDFDAWNTAENDMFSLDLQYAFDNGLTLSSITAYSEDEYLARYATIGAVADIPFNNTPASPGGVISDPQVGTGNVLSSSYFIDQTAEQFSQELRLQSEFDGDLNFSVGLIYVDLDITNRIYGLGNVTSWLASAVNTGAGAEVIYIDPNTIPNAEGHNYFVSSSPYNLKASALFGELYYDVSDTVKATIGLRYTEDKKEQYTFPIQLLQPGRGFPDVPPQDVTFRELTGRFTLDWQATDNSLIYASLSRGYKGGGFNPPASTAGLFPPTFEPEFVNSLEIGSKSSFADGRGLLNLTGFMYDYKDYQISKLVNQSVINENVDADILGLEIESSFLVTENFRLDAQIGYISTEIGDVQSIDTSNLTQGDAAYTVVNSIDSGSFAEACIVPTAEVAGLLGAIAGGFAPSIAMGTLCTGPTASPNALEGIEVDVSGNELPSTPSYTAAIGAEYSMMFNNSDWEATARADYYRQADSFARIYNTAADKIKSWDNLNLSYRLSNESTGWEVQVYARNILSKDTVTNIQLNSTSTGGSSVVSGKERPMYGISVSKSWF